MPCVKCKIEEHPSERGPFIPRWLNNLEVSWVIAQVRFHSLTGGKSFQVESCRCLGWDARNWRYELSFKALCTKINRWEQVGLRDEFRKLHKTQI